MCALLPVVTGISQSVNPIDVAVVPATVGVQFGALSWLYLLEPSFKHRVGQQRRWSRCAGVRDGHVVVEVDQRAKKDFAVSALKLGDVGAESLIWRIGIEIVYQILPARLPATMRLRTISLRDVGAIFGDSVDVSNQTSICWAMRSFALVRAVALRAFHLRLQVFFAHDRANRFFPQRQTVRFAHFTHAAVAVDHAVALTGGGNHCLGLAFSID